MARTKKTKPAGKTTKAKLRAEARKPIARRDVANRKGTTEFYSEPSVMGQKAFRVPVAIIRSDAEFAKTCPRGPELATLLGQVMNEPGLPPHGTGDLRISLLRNRAIQSRLIECSIALAEATWPGYHAMMQALGEREMEFTKALGELGVGVA